jgi:hypothetical protein
MAQDVRLKMEAQPVLADELGALSTLLWKDTESPGYGVT